MKCPQCKLINPDTAQICDCGYNFTTGVQGKPLEGSHHTNVSTPSNSLCRPNGVTAVGVVLIIMAALLLVVGVYMTSLLSEGDPSLLLLITLSNFLSAGLLVAMGIGILAGRTWARTTFFWFVPINAVFAIFSGIGPGWFTAFVLYPIFVYVLARPNAKEYFRY